MLNRRQLGVGTAMERPAVTRRPLMVIIIGPALFTVHTMRHDLLTAAPMVQRCGAGVRGAGDPGGGVGGAGATAGDGGSKRPAITNDQARGQLSLVNAVRSSHRMPHS